MQQNVSCYFTTSSSGLKNPGGLAHTLIAAAGTGGEAEHLRIGDSVNGNDMQGLL